MRAWLLYGALILNLINPAAAQQSRVTEGEAHILSAFISGADPAVLADGVKIGPALRGELGAEADSRKIYDALVARTSGKKLRVDLLTPAEVGRYASLPGVTAGEPLIRLEADELVFLLHYAAKEKNVTFVEQVSKPAPRTQAPKAAPIVEVPLPTVPPTPGVLRVAPAVIEKPVRSRFAVQPPSAPIRSGEVPRPAAITTTQTPAPQGECVIKPVMTEEDLRNCAVVPRPVLLEKPTPLPAVEKREPPAPPPALQPRAECEIKPVMSEEDLRACGARR